MMRCIGFARRWGCGSLEAVNLFAWLTPHPKEFRLADDPVGPENDARLIKSLARADRIVAARGNWGACRGEIAPSSRSSSNSESRSAWASPDPATSYAPVIGGVASGFFTQVTLNG